MDYLVPAISIIACVAVVGIAFILNAREKKASRGHWKSEDKE